MNRNEITQQTNKDIKTFQRTKFLTGQYADAAKLIGALTLDVHKLSLTEGEDSMLNKSTILKEIIAKTDGKISLTELMTASQYASAIEFENTKAYTALRDTAGEKPIDKVQRMDNPINKISDKDLDKILEIAVIEIAED